MFFNDFGVPGTPKSDQKSLKSGFLALLDTLMDSWAALGALFRPTCLFFGRLGTSSAALGPSWARLGGVLWAPWARLGASWVALGTVLGCLGGVLGSFRVLSDWIRVVQGVHTHNPQKPKEN